MFTRRLTSKSITRFMRSRLRLPRKSRKGACVIYVRWVWYLCFCGPVPFFCCIRANLYAHTNNGLYVPKANRPAFIYLLYTELRVRWPLTILAGAEGCLLRSVELHFEVFLGGSCHKIEALRPQISQQQPHGAGLSQ